MQTIILSALLVALIVLILHWPYRRHRTWDFLGRESGELRSALYRYVYGPTYDRLDYDGMRRLQVWLLLIVTTVAVQLQPDLITWISKVIRQVLGL